MSCTTSFSSVACTLSSDQFNERLARIALMARRHLLAQHQDGQTLRLHYAREALHELRALVEMERDCCAHLGFELKEDGSVVELALTAPPGTEASAAFVFGAFKGVSSVPSGGRCTGGACGCPSS